MVKTGYHSRNVEYGGPLMRNKRKPTGYWDDFANVEGHLLAAIEQHGTAGTMISVEKLRKLGHGDIVRAITRHGGVTVVAERLGLLCTHKPYGYWEDLAHVERA